MTSPRGGDPRPVLILALGVLGVSSAAILIRLAAVPALTVTAWRLTGGALFFGIVLKVRREAAPWKGLTRSEAGLLFLSAAALAAHFATWILSLEYTSVVSSVVLVTTTPIWVALGSAFLLRERVLPAVWFGILVAVAGGIWIGTSDARSLPGSAGSAPLLGDLLAILGSLCVSVYYLAGRRLRRKMSTVRYVTGVYGGAAVLAIPIALIGRAPLVGFSPSSYIFLLLIILLPQIIGHTSFNWVLGHLPATITTVAVLLEPVGAGLLAWWILDEAPGAGQAFGGLVVLSGILIAMEGERRAAAVSRSACPPGTGSSGVPVP